MTTPINLALYRLLLKTGATEAEAEEAARTDTADLATKGDILAVKADLKALEARLIQWTVGIVFTAMSLQTALLVFLFSQLRR